MNEKVLDILEKSLIVNDAALPFWIYKVESVIVSGKRFLKIFLFNKEDDKKQLDIISFAHNGAEYPVSRFNVVSEYNDPNIVGVAFETPVEDFETDVKIVKELVDGKLFTPEGNDVVYIKAEVPKYANYIKEKIPAYSKLHKFYPKISDKYWQCSCGRIYSLNNSNCNCGLTIDTAKEILNFNVEDARIKDYLLKPISYDLNQSFMNNVENYKSTFLNLYSINPEKMIERVDLKSEEEKYNALIAEKIEKEKIAKAKVKKAKIITFSFIALVLLAILSVAFIVPETRYFIAEKNYEKGEFDKAIKTFESLDYKDSADKVLEVKYAKAENCIENHEYDEAIDLFRELSKEKYNDSTDRIYETLYLKAYYLNDCKEYEESFKFLDSLTANRSKIPNFNDMYNKAGYEYGKQLLEEGNLKEGIDVLSSIIKTYEDTSVLLNDARYTYAETLYNEGNLKDAYTNIALSGCERTEDLYRSITYDRALELVSEKDYKEAIKLFTLLDGYSDSRSQINNAKYLFVTSHRNRTDTTTYSYLKDLKSIGYKDSASIYNDLYAWKVSIVINNSESDETTDKASVSRSSTWYCHIKVSGGPPEESIMLKYSGSFPHGSTRSNSWDWSMRDGSTSWASFWYTSYGSYGGTGTFTFNVYDSSGNRLATDSVNITY